MKFSRKKLGKLGDTREVPASELHSNFYEAPSTPFKTGKARVSGIRTFQRAENSHFIAALRAIFAWLVENVPSFVFKLV